MADPITLTVLNPAAQPAPAPVVYVGETATLNVTLQNLTGSVITLNSGSNPSQFEIFMPLFYTDAEVQAMSISLTGISLTDWEFSYNSADVSLMLKFNGPNGTEWANGTNITFSITNATSNAGPGPDSIQVNPTNMGNNVSGQPQAPLTLSNPPQPGNASLSDILQVWLDNQGSVYVSLDGDPLSNSLFLNFKNTSTNDVYTGSSMWTGNPQVIVSFIYGWTSGALAPDDKGSSQQGSAWNIQASISVAEGNRWTVIPPSITGQSPSPTWVLKPTDLGIIGTGVNANISFEFSQIISFTAPGNTQMVVQFTGFWKDENTRYNDEVFILNIAKQYPPPTRGLVSFFGTNPSPLVTVNSPTQPVQIPLHWSMFDVASVTMFCSFPGIAPVTITYPNFQPLDYDNYTLTIPGTSQSTAIIITLQAYDGNGHYLNSMQFTVYVTAQVFVDPRDGKVYPTILVNGTLWMTKNLDWNGSGSYAYNNDGSNESQYGRLYTLAAAQQVPVGWRLPSQSDWNKLISAEGSQAYQALMAGGSSGFNAQLGGYRDNNGNYTDLGVRGYYWTSSGQDANDIYYAQFSSVSKSVSTSNTYPPAFAVSVRYVQNT